MFAQVWTVTSVLRVMGLSDDVHVQNDHRVLNRTVCSSLAVSQVLLGLLMSAFASVGTLVMAMDDTIEPRPGDKLKAKGIYRDPLRSSHSHVIRHPYGPSASLKPYVTLPDWAEWTKSS